MRSITHKGYQKDKAIHETGHGGPKGCETSRLPHFLQAIGSQMAVSLSALRAGRSLPQGRFLVLVSVRGYAKLHKQKHERLFYGLCVGLKHISVRSKRAVEIVLSPTLTFIFLFYFTLSLRCKSNYCMGILSKPTVKLSSIFCYLP
jgi:hypothetical protein